ncbi:P-loop NTPase, partial [Klebsiella oxytoca]|uniref:P-loop NTPase n=1 Tax=Klebsiella oxytoca TaxID=571 RepID=UPI001C820453
GLSEAKKGMVMVEKVEVPVLGIVKNISMHICSNCGHHEAIVGTGGMGIQLGDQRPDGIVVIDGFDDRTLFDQRIAFKIHLRN